MKNTLIEEIHYMGLEKLVRDPGIRSFLIKVLEKRIQARKEMMDENPGCDVKQINHLLGERENKRQDTVVRDS